MSKLLRNCLATLALFVPAFAWATTSAYVSLSNFSYEVSGPGISVTPGSFIAVSSGAVNSDPSTAASTNVLGPDYSFAVTHNISDGTNNAQGIAQYAPGDASSVISSQTNISNGNYSFVNTWASVRIDYLANTTFTLSADAYINISPDPGQQAFGSAAIDIGSSHSENAYFSRLAFTPTTATDHLSVTFFSPKDETLFLTVTSYVTANVLDEPPVSVVPEPESYAMLLSGLFLIGFAAIRKKKH